MTSYLKIKVVFFKPGVLKPNKKYEELYLHPGIVID